MKTKQLFYLLILPLLFFLTSCEGKFKDWSPQKIEAYIAENFPIGTNRKKIESFFDEQKLSYDWHEQYKILGCLIRFVYDGYKLIEELNALNNNAVLRRYTWSPVGLDTPVSVYDASANATYYYNTDANKNITELTDATGTVVAHYEYSPFGKVLVANGAYASINPFRFSSEYHDDESGLVYYNYRYYSPELGRWMSRDPIGERGGWNLYIAFNNSSVNAIDHKGHIAIFALIPLIVKTFGYFKLGENLLLGTLSLWNYLDCIDRAEQLKSEARKIFCDELTYLQWEKMLNQGQNVLHYSLIL